MRIKILVFLLCLLCVQTVQADWVKQNTKTFSWFRDVFFVNENIGWIGGADGALLKTRDGGKSWQQVRKFTSDTIVQVLFSDENIGILLVERSMFTRGQNASSYLLKTLDGGENWQRLEFPEGSRQKITKLLFNEKGAGMAFGESGLFYRLREDGREWVKIPAAIHYLMLDGAFTGVNGGAIVGGGGTILFTEDGGFTWTKASIFGEATSRLNSVFFIDEKVGWTVGNDGKIFRTAGGGKLWRPQTSGTLNNLNDVYFTDSNNGWIVGDKGTVMRTRDGGTTWYPVEAGTDYRLEKVIFVGKKGWAVGFGGTILEYDENFKKENIKTEKPTLLRRG